MALKVRLFPDNFIGLLVDLVFGVVASLLILALRRKFASEVINAGGGISTA